ncbi:bifunctional endoribonuclease/protein kinase ire1 [Didymella glomerata]|uniref:non-specific serine/threonine protein kinase n=1 Tax=Didymella glomerata TaxID=749621 RepID=A0A9W8X218_9PLEO|nr:bifunctional endoribonuclease/protein kinase ire1 [Didymella glomerata]
MPRPRRPPGAGLTLTTLLAIVILGPSFLAVAQQQQQPPRSVLAHTIHPNQGKSTHAQESAGRVARHRPNSPVFAQDESALATHVSSAPAVSAVGAPSAANAATGALAPSARSLQDWEVEDFVLLATVDGRIHARDRYTGQEIWELTGQPMLETIYNGNGSDDAGKLQDQPFVWIVEPKEDGALYFLTPGPYPALHRLGMTVKQLANMAPYSSEDPALPVVYNVEKSTFMLVVEAASGKIKKSFSPSGTYSVDDESCAPKGRDYFHAREHECSGSINLGQTQYTISIHNKQTNEHICTIKYAEWAPNNRDRDLQIQYSSTMDNQYIYSRYNGQVMALDHNRLGKSRGKPVFTQNLPYPVARVFDVARPTNDDSPEPALILLPQPAGKVGSEERAKHVWLNTTDTGAWYALSEQNYPVVTDGAPDAACYEYRDLLDWDGPHSLPDQQNLVGVHKLDQKLETPSRYLAIAAPTAYHAEEGQPVSRPPETSPMERPAIEPPPRTETMIETRAAAVYTILISFLVMAGTVSAMKYSPPLDKLVALFTKPPEAPKVKEVPIAFSSPTISEAEFKPDDQAESKLEIQQEASQGAAPKPNPEIEVENTPEAIPEVKTVETVPAVETVAEAVSPSQLVPEATVEAPTDPEAKEKKVVSFDIPEDNEADLSLSRTTTIEQSSPTEGDSDDATPVSAEKTSSAANGTSDSTAQDPNGATATPTKKKKTHRGKRGGRKLNKNQQKEEDDVDRIVDAAKKLDPSPTLHPDEVTMNGDDMQDVSNIKRIGKLTIDQDKLLGNGSGGTFVFEGKWNDRDVAIKRMLPQYFGLAEQEVKLLQESDLHPNVIRYFDDEKDENFLYIAVEMCQASLFDLFRDGRPGEDLTDAQRRLVNEINRDVPRTLYQLANGLNHLHSLRIIHRDIKPQNILIAYPQRTQNKGPRLVISDFGLCKTLPDNVSTLIGTTGNAGTVGWKAPELISQPRDVDRGSSTGYSRDSSTSTDPVAQGVKRAVDIFSLGCVFYYVLTNGSHPFDDEEGWMQMREYNIKKEKANLEGLRLGDDSEEPYWLIQWMLKTRPEDRPTALQVMNHPFFWSAEKRLNFLCDCSDHWEREPRDPPSNHLNILEDWAEEILDHRMNFLAKLDKAFIDSLGKQRKYTGDRILDLLRALRNKKNHYEDMDENVKAKVGPLPHGYLRYWTTKFPTLLMSCYEAVQQCGLQDAPRFKPYFEGQTM